MYEQLRLFFKILQKILHLSQKYLKVQWISSKNLSSMTKISRKLLIFIQFSPERPILEPLKVLL